MQNIKRLLKVHLLLFILLLLSFPNVAKASESIKMYDTKIQAIDEYGKYIPNVHVYYYHIANYGVYYDNEVLIGITDENGTIKIKTPYNLTDIKTSESLVLSAWQPDIDLKEVFSIKSVISGDSIILKLTDNKSYLSGKLPTCRLGNGDIFKEKYSRTYIVIDKDGNPVPNANLSLIYTNIENIASPYSLYDKYVETEEITVNLGQTSTNGILMMDKRHIPYVLKERSSILRVERQNGNITEHTVKETSDTEEIRIITSVLEKTNTPVINPSKSNEFTYWIDDEFTIDMELEAMISKNKDISIKVIHAPNGRAKEHLDMLIASNSTPDALDMKWYGDREIDSGLIIDLSKKLMQNAPNYLNTLKNDNAALKAAKSDSGKIPAFIYLNKANESFKAEATAGIYICQTWLNELKLPIPRTIEQWEATLSAFKTDMKKYDVTPFFIDMSFKNLIAAFSSAYDVYLDYYVDRNTGKITNGYLEPSGKKLIEKLSWFYKQGYIDREIKINKESTRNNLYALAMGNVGAIFSTIDNAELLINGFNLSPVPFPTRTEYDEPYNISNVKNRLSGRGIGISAKCTNPEFLMRFFDKLYMPEALDDQINRSDEVFNKYAVNAFQVMLPPTLTLSEDEEEELSRLNDKISEYASKECLSFIIGTRPLAEYDKYTSSLKQMGIGRCIQLYQAALDRYNER